MVFLSIDRLVSIQSNYIVKSLPSLLWSFHAHSYADSDDRPKVPSTIKFTVNYEFGNYSEGYCRHPNSLQSDHRAILISPKIFSQEEFNRICYGKSLWMNRFWCIPTHASCSYSPRFNYRPDHQSKAYTNWHGWHHHRKLSPFKWLHSNCHRSPVSSHQRKLSTYRDRLPKPNAREWWQESTDSISACVNIVVYS